MRSRWLAEVAPSALGGIAEAGWIGVYAAAIGAPSGGTGPSGSLAVLVLAALSGVAAGRVLPFGRSRPVAIFTLAVLAALAGMLISQAAGLVSTTALSLSTDLFLGLAVLRGAAHGNPDARDGAIDGLVRLSPVLMGAGWLLGLEVAGDARSEFIVEAFDATILFIVAAALGLGLARLQALAADARQEGTNRAWLVLALVVVGSVVLVALPVAAFVGLPVARGVTAVLIGVPLTVAGAIVGIAGAAGGIVGLLLTALVRLIVPARNALPVASPAPGAPEPPPPVLAAGADATTDLIVQVVGVLLLVVLIGLAWYLAVRWQGRRRERKPTADVAERRSIALELSLGLPALRVTSRLRALRSPRDALEAYPRLLDDWSAPHPRARQSSETPAAHARRLRSEGHGDLGLDLLVADFELACFGAVRLTGREERRAVARWDRLRRRAEVTAARSGAADGETPSHQGG
jgi:hypothetical protein